MQAAGHGDHRGASGPDAGTTEGILEDPHGVNRLFVGGQLVATLYDVRSNFIDGCYILDDEAAYQIEWRRWSIGKLVWAQAPGILFLQGATLQQLLVPFCLLAGTPRLMADPEPGMNDVVLAELYACSSDDLTYPQLFQLLAPEARGA